MRLYLCSNFDMHLSLSLVLLVCLLLRELVDFMNLKVIELCYASSICFCFVYLCRNLLQLIITDAGHIDSSIHNINPAQVCVCVLLRLELMILH